MPQLNVSSEAMLVEIETSINVLVKWKGAIEKGIPGVDLPAPEDRTEEFLRQLVSELRLIEGKCETLADVLAG